MIFPDKEITLDDAYDALNRANETVINRKIFYKDVLDEDEQHLIILEISKILGIEYGRELK